MVERLSHNSILSKSIIFNLSYIARPSTPSPDIWTSPDAVQDESKFIGQPATILDSAWIELCALENHKNSISVYT